MNAFKRTFGGIVVLVVMIQLACEQEHRQYISPAPEMVLPGDDLEQIKERGTLVVLTENSSISFYLYKGQGMGYDYELISAFAKDHDLKVEVHLINDLNDMFELLQNGEGDVIACNLTATEKREDLVSFTSPLTHSRQVLVQRRPNGRMVDAEDEADSLITDWQQLDGKEIFVHRFSVYYDNLMERVASDSIQLDIIEASGSLSSERLIKLVADGQIDYTIADENVALLNATYYPNIDVSFSLGEPDPIAWAVRKDADSLRFALNDWIESKKTHQKRNFIYHKYFKATKSQQSRVQSSYSSLDGKQISQYDEIIQRYSKDIRWDWRLLAAMIYNESRFNHEAKSWAGAFGLMQMMPRTAERFGIDTTHTQEANIRAGVAYIKYLDRFWRKHIEDPEERVNFILASYNVGPGHVQDARVIARHLEKDPDVWFNNVADCLLLKVDSEFSSLEGVKNGYCRCSEPVNYVTNVRSKFAEYRVLSW